MRAIKPEIVKPRKPKLLIFGPPKSHKTRLALQFPGNYYIDVESGAREPHYRQDLIDAGSVYMGPEQGSQDIATVIDEVRWLRTNKHDYKAITLDSLSKLSNVGFYAEEARMIDANISIEYGANKKPTMRQVRRLWSLLETMDLTVILLCHEKDLWEGKGKDRGVVGKTFDAWDKLEYEMDLVCQSRRLGATASMTVTASRYKQFPIGNTVPMEYKAFAQIYGQEIIEKPSEPVVPLTEDQLAEIKRLVDLLKIPEDAIDKWLTKSKVSEVEDLSKDQANALLEDLNKKLKGTK